MMEDGAILRGIKKGVSDRKKFYWILLDPDDFGVQEGAEIGLKAEEAGVSGILIGGSLLNTTQADRFAGAVSREVDIPVILFPGDATQVIPSADAILFMSLISGRNPENLIGEQVKGAVLVKKFGIEPIPTAYMLVESGATTSVEFLSNTRPLPRNKPGIACSHALAAKYLGMEAVYLEAGSGAEMPVPNDIIGAVKGETGMVVITGGGIRTPETALSKVKAGSDIIVTGNMLNKGDGLERMKEISEAVKSG